MMLKTFDLYEHWQTPTDPARPLSPFQERLILSALPPSARIEEALPARNWSPFPVRVRVVTTAWEQFVYLRKDVKVGGVELEAALLPVLGKLGLPVAKLLAGPVVDPAGEDGVPVTVISELPGENLLDFSWEAKGNDVYIVMHLVLEGVRRLHAVTTALQQEPVAAIIPVKTLLGELAGIEARGGPWLEVAEFRQALRRLEKRLPALEAPLVFSNGDYNPGNFLFSVQGSEHQEERNHSIGNPGSLAKIPHRLTGIVDFAWACFEDPHIGFAKYWTYDWFPSGMIEHYLYVNRIGAHEFAPRLALRCLWTLQRETEPPYVDARTSWYRDNLLGLLEMAMSSF